MTPSIHRRSGGKNFLNFSDKGKEQTVGGRLVGDLEIGIPPASEEEEGVSEVEGRGERATFFLFDP